MNTSLSDASASWRHRPRRPRTDPLVHITEDRCRYQITIRRGGKVWWDRVLKREPDALAKAIALRDRLLAQAGPRRPMPMRVGPHARPESRHSNTGHTGICEIVRFVKYRPRYAFRVQLNYHGLPQYKLLYYGPRSRTREQALEQAIALRRAFIANTTAQPSN